MLLKVCLLNKLCKYNPEKSNQVGAYTFNLCGQNITLWAFNY